MATIELEETQEDKPALENIDPTELERILTVLGTKCCNRILVEEMYSRKEYNLPGILRGYCRYCLGYKPLGQCNKKGYNNILMRHIETIKEIE